MNTSKSEAKQKIEAVYAEYRGKLNNLKEEQNKVIAEFIATLENAKIEELKNNIGAN